MPVDDPTRKRLLIAEQAFSRAAGAPLIQGNAVELLTDTPATFDAWLVALRAARHTILFENYIYSDDELGREFRDTLAERAAAGVKVHVLRDWLGCFGESLRRVLAPAIQAGGEVRAYNPPHIASPFGWLSRDHRKLALVDNSVGFIGGHVRQRHVARRPGQAHSALARYGRRDPRPRPARPRGRVRGSVGNARRAARGRSDSGCMRPHRACRPSRPARRRHGSEHRGPVSPRSTDRGDGAANLWLTDAYFVGIAPYVQALVAAARDGVDVRLLVPGTSDIPAVGSLSRAGYRPLLEAGVQACSNGTARCCTPRRRSPMGAGPGRLEQSQHCQLDRQLRDRCGDRGRVVRAARWKSSTRCDLGNATEIVLTMSRHSRYRTRASDESRRGRVRGGSSSRAAAGAMRFANSVGAAITDRRVLGDAESGLLLVGAVFSSSVRPSACSGRAWSHGRSRCSRSGSRSASSSGATRKRRSPEPRRAHVSHSLPAEGCRARSDVADSAADASRVAPALDAPSSARCPIPTLPLPPRDVYTPTALTRFVRDLLEDVLPLVWIEGEISNVSRPASGHLYFTLKDSAAQVRCAMFKPRSTWLAFQAGRRHARARRADASASTRRAANSS